MQSQQPNESTQAQTVETAQTERLPWSEPLLQKMPLEVTAGKPSAGGDGDFGASS